MLTAARPIAAGVSVLAAIALSIDAWRLAASDSIVFETNRVIDSADWRKAQPPLEAWLRARNELLEAESLAPRSGMVAEALGILHARRADSREFLVYARDYFVHSLELRPTSPYTWANYARTKYLLGETGPAFERALGNAARLGPWEPDVQRLVADMGLAVLNEVQPDTRREIEAIVSLGMRRNPLEILQIAEKRGRLDVACRYVPGNRRLSDVKWITLCERRSKT